MTSFSGFDSAALDFLRGLGVHNDRAWFDAHRADYEELLLLPAREFVTALGDRLAVIAPAVHADPRVNGSILRINRDTRFSTDKRPYKTHLDLWLWEGDGPSRACSGFFLSIEADRIGYGAGMHHFEKDVLGPTGRRSTIPAAGRRSCGRRRRPWRQVRQSAERAGSGCPRRTQPTIPGRSSYATAGWSPAHGSACPPSSLRRTSRTGAWSASAAAAAPEVGGSGGGGRPVDGHHAQLRHVVVAVGVGEPALVRAGQHLGELHPGAGRLAGVPGLAGQDPREGRARRVEVHRLSLER
jgi:hypothetical protein